MSLKLFGIIANISTFLFGLGFLLTLVQIRKSEFFTNKLISAFFLLSLLSNLAQLVAIIIKKGAPGVVGNYVASIYYVLSFLVISCIYYYETRLMYKKAFAGTCVLFTCLAASNLIFIQRSSINSYTAILFAAIVILYATFYFYWLIQELPTTHLQRLPMFWINSAFIVYCSGNFFLFVFTSYLVNVLNNNLLMYWSLHNLLSIIQSLMIITSVLISIHNARMNHTG